MANAKKKWVAFKSAAIIPAEMAGEDEDTKVKIGEPVHVPAFYADSVVQDRIADHCDAPKSKSESKSKAAARKTKKQTAAEKPAELIAAAEQVVADAQTKFDSAVGDDARYAAQLELTAAKDALTALQA